MAVRVWEGQIGGGTDARRKQCLRRSWTQRSAGRHYNRWRNLSSMLVQRSCTFPLSLLPSLTLFLSKESLKVLQQELTATREKYMKATSERDRSLMNLEVSALRSRAHPVDEPANNLNNVDQVGCPSSRKSNSKSTKDLDQKDAQVREEILCQLQFILSVSTLQIALLRDTIDTLQKVGCVKGESMHGKVPPGATCTCNHKIDTLIQRVVQLTSQTELQVRPEAAST